MRPLGRLDSNQDYLNQNQARCRVTLRPNERQWYLPSKHPAKTSVSVACEASSVTQPLHRALAPQHLDRLKQGRRNQASCDRRADRLQRILALQARLVGPRHQRVVDRLQVPRLDRREDLLDVVEQGCSFWCKQCSGLLVGNRFVEKEAKLLGRF